MRVDRSHEQKDAFEDAVSKAPLLKYFSESDLTENLGDASKDGLQFLQMQHGQPGKSLTGALAVAERKYWQIEKEFLAPVLVMERNH